MYAGCFQSCPGCSCCCLQFAELSSTRTRCWKRTSIDKNSTWAAPPGLQSARSSYCHSCASGHLSTSQYVKVGLRRTSGYLNFQDLGCGPESTLERFCYLCTRNYPLSHSFSKEGCASCRSTLICLLFPKLFELLRPRWNLACFYLLKSSRLGSIDPKLREKKLVEMVTMMLLTTTTSYGLLFSLHRNSDSFAKKFDFAVVSLRFDTEFQLKVFHSCW